jgi:uncharacterized protein (DUF427 family)
MLEPGPSHPITISAAPGPVRIRFNGEVIAESNNALALHEANYRPVFYIPRADVRPELLHKTGHASHCPYKGDASYYTIEADGRRSENAIWSYEAPFPAVAAIAGHLAFYPDRVDSIELG